MINLKSPKNANYCATVVELKHFAPLAGCDNVQAAQIFGSQVIVGKDAKPGDIGLFFPVEVALSREFLAANNLYRKPEWGNADPAKRGFFEEHGRVKCVKFRGHKSEGFFIPLTAIEYICPTGEFQIGMTGAFQIGAEFDELNGHPICKKYVPYRTPGKPGSGKERVARGRAEDRILSRQFNYHIDTGKLDRNIHRLQPSDIISVTDKWHGTSAIFAHILTNRPLKWYERLLAALGVKIDKHEYAHVWASRRVIKGVGDAPRQGVQHYYKSDIWGTVHEEVKDLIPQGYTLYGEIVGYTPDGSPIQAGYHYGCAPGQHKFLVYRITFTSVNGRVFDLSWPQIKEFCQSRGLETVREIYYGPAIRFGWWEEEKYDYSPYVETERWQGEFLDKLKRLHVKDSMCPFNNLEVPAEGVVLRIERSTEFEAYKCKSTKFLEWETKQLDKGVLDIETMESENVLEE